LIGRCAIILMKLPTLCFSYFSNKVSIMLGSVLDRDPPTCTPRFINNIGL
jgi:hypothetical protein